MDLLEEPLDDAPVLDRKTRKLATAPMKVLDFAASEREVPKTFEEEVRSEFKSLHRKLDAFIASLNITRLAGRKHKLPFPQVVPLTPLSVHNPPDTPDKSDSDTGSFPSVVKKCATAPLDRAGTVPLGRSRTTLSSASAVSMKAEPVPLATALAPTVGSPCQLARQPTMSTVGEAVVLEPDTSWATSISRRSSVKHRKFHTLHQAWNFLEVPESSHAAGWYAQIMPWFILSSVLVTLAQSIEPFDFGGVAAAAIETTIDFIFFFEVLARFIACPSKRMFFASVHSWIDIFGALPLFIRAAAGFVLPSPWLETVWIGILLCAVPVVRLVKVVRWFEQFNLLLNAFTRAFEALPVLLFILCVIALVFTMLIYVTEPRSNIESFMDALWLTIVTMTTVGYGDLTPKSPAGSTITGVLIVTTVLYMAVPLGIIGNAFTETWNDRHRILVMHRTRDRLAKWGYTAFDIPELFLQSDKNSDGELDIDEFRELIQAMQLGITEESIYELFRSFDKDGSDTVDDKEFVRALFPNSYAAIYEQIQAAKDDDEIEFYRSRSGSFDETPMGRLFSDASVAESGSSMGMNNAVQAESKLSSVQQLAPLESDEHEVVAQAESHTTLCNVVPSGIPN